MVYVYVTSKNGVIMFGGFSSHDNELKYSIDIILKNQHRPTCMSVILQKFI